MSVTSRRKGRRWENHVVAWLQEHGYPYVERNEYLNAQAGDILGLPGWSLECKNGQRLELATWLTQASIQAAYANADHYALIVKRKGTADPGDSYVVMPLSVFADWMKT